MPFRECYHLFLSLFCILKSYEDPNVLGFSLSHAAMLGGGEPAVARVPGGLNCSSKGPVSRQPGSLAWDEQKQLGLLKAKEKLTVKRDCGKKRERGDSHVILSRLFLPLHWPDIQPSYSHHAAAHVLGQESSWPGPWWEKGNRSVFYPSAYSVGERLLMHFLGTVAKLWNQDKNTSQPYLETGRINSLFFFEVYNPQALVPEK